MTAKRSCKTCHVEKPVSQFYKHGTSFNTVCIECIKAARRDSYNGEKRINKLASNKRHRIENSEYYQQYHLQYYLENKERILARSRDHYESVIGRAKALHTSAKRRTKIEFSVSIDLIVLKIIGGICERSGIRFDLSVSDKTFRNPYAPSIDRIDNTKGYTNDNVQIVTNMYNTGKGQHTDEEFILFCHAVAAKNPIT